MGFRISVVTPTLGRPEEVVGLLKNLAAQTLRPTELILVDGAPSEDRVTEEAVAIHGEGIPFPIRFIRGQGGTALQRNTGIDSAAGDFVAFVDDDIRLEPDFFERVIEVFTSDSQQTIGGVTGYITNQHLDPATSPRWRLYRKLKLFTTYEPGKYDYHTGYPINRYLQPPHRSRREVDFMGAGCAVWRRQVFDGGLRFDGFFSGFGVLEDAHLALRAKRRWKLVEDGTARCTHLQAKSSRESDFQVGRKTAVNYRYVFVDIVPERTVAQDFRFWLVQTIDVMRIASASLRGGGFSSLRFAAGKMVGMLQGLALGPRGNRGSVPEDGSMESR